VESANRDRTGFRVTRRRRSPRRRRIGVLVLLASVVMATIAFQAQAAGASAARSASTNGSHASARAGGNSLHVPATIQELPVPPTAPATGCTNATGCVSGAWGALGSPGFFWNPHYVLLGVTYAGAPAAPDPASIYSGPQVLLEKTDGTTFPNGDAWKCLTCGVPASNEQGVITSDFTYPPPHALPGDKKVLVGNGILQCGNGRVNYAVTDPRCTAADTQIYPIYWDGTPLGAPPSATSPLGNGREWRLSPDGVHLAWDSLFVINRISFGENEFEGTLQFDPADQRYNLTDVYFLPQATAWVVKGDGRLQFNPTAMIGELRGWSSDGKSILGIQSYESDSIDAWATSLATGRSVPLTNHAEYTDPMFMSPNGRWMINEEVAGSGRLDFISAMQGIPPITDLLTTAYVSGIRNNQNRRFFLPWLVSPATGQSEQINAGGDPNWNAAADPVWLADSNGVVWAENLACGANPTPHQCAASSEPGGRNSRVMIARFPTLPPSKALVPAPISNTAPAKWAVPYTGQTLAPSVPFLPAGTYTIKGHARGFATVVVTDNSAGTGIQSIQATYYDYSQDGRHVINGTESVQNDSTPGNVTWNEGLTLSGRQQGTKVTSPGGFTLGLATEFENIFLATGTMTTTIDGQTYTQPATGT
jgi:hypothetical protein